MSDEPSREAIEAMKARVLKQAADQFDRDMADIARLASKYPGLVNFPPSSGKSAAAPATVETQETQKNEGQPTGQALASLAQQYCTHEQSPYHQIRHTTRSNYDSMLRRLQRDLPEQIEALDKECLERTYAQWIEASGLSMAHALVTMLRALATFGSTVLKNQACRDLRMLLHDMNFQNIPRRTERITRDQANAIRAMAHKMGRSSIALAQAFQFDCGLRQNDVIGQWVPENETGNPYMQHGGHKWLAGICWEQVDRNLLLRYVAFISGKETQISLRSSRMVLEDLMLQYGLDETEVFDRSRLPQSGPIILCEYDRRPWTNHEFRRWWRKLADACDIPRTVKNMDSRPRMTATANGKKNSAQGPNETHEILNGGMEAVDFRRVSRH